MNAQERREYAAKKSREWHATPAGQAYERKKRERLFHPDWEVLPGPRKWSFSEDVHILLRTRSDAQLAKQFKATSPALRQRRYRLQRLLYTASHHSRIAYQQTEYARRLRKKVGNLV